MLTAKLSATASAPDSPEAPDSPDRPAQKLMAQSTELRNAPDANARAVAFLRIAVGILFLIFGEYKVFGTQFTLHGGFQFWINKWLQEGGAYPFMVGVLQNFVLPHATLIAFLTA